MYTYICTYIYTMYTERERGTEKERERDRQRYPILCV